MLNKKLMAGVAGVVLLSGTAFANGASMEPFPAAAPAPMDHTGIYVGLMGGYADTHWGNLDGFTPSNGSRITVSDNNWGVRPFLGYQIDRIFSVEAGWTYFGHADIKAGGTETTVKQWAIDLMGKITVPLTNGFNLFAKAGGAYMGVKDKHNHNTSGTTVAKADESHFGPAYGVGVSYAFMPELVGDVSWMHWSGQGDLSGSDYIPTSDMAAIGLAYRFNVA